jgi:DNA-binding NarL/FixJ family response regulator
MKKIELLVVDDHELFRDGLKAILSNEKEMEVKYEASNAKEGLAVIAKNTPDVVLMDISMPEINGIECTRMMLSKNPNLKILALTMHDEGKVIKEIIEAEAMGYVIKDAGKAILKEAILSVNSGENYFPKHIMTKVITSLKADNSISEVRLTKREKQVLQLICKELTTQEISAHLHISNNTVETHRKNLLNKTACKNSVGLMRFALENNLT